jgi:cell wall assembly regulator SMI1
MQDVWDRIESWLAINAPKVLKSLQPGASEGEIREAEEALDVQFPPEVKQSFRLHNGQFDCTGALIPDQLSPEDLNYPITDPCSGWQLLSLKNIVTWWSEWMELLNVGETDWNRFWIPLTYDEGGNHDCLDLDPKLGSNSGRIVRTFHETIPDIESDAEFKMAVNFRVWLEQFAIDLESGIYEYAEEYDRLIDAKVLRHISASQPIRDAQIQEFFKKMGLEP